MPTPDPPRYRMTRAAFDLVSVFACIGALRLPGPVFAAVLGSRGYSAQSVRNQLVRMVNRGLLRREPAGRLTVYARTPSLADSFARFGGRHATPAYRGSFPALLVTIPESRRADRDRVLHVAGMRGYRQLRPGVLIAVRDESHELRRQLTKLVPAEDGIDQCRLVPESIEQARELVARAFGTEQSAEAVTALAARVTRACSDADLTPGGYFDLFHDVALAADRIELLPRELLADGADGPDGQDSAVRVRALLQTMIELWARFLEQTIAEVMALPQTTLELIEWDSAFWQRAGHEPPAIAAR